MAVLNIGQYGDALSVHAYPWETMKQSIWEKYRDLLAFYQELYPSLEIWLTETGYPLEYEGEKGQAQYMNDALDYFEGKVTRFFWYSLLDNVWEDQSFGLIVEGMPRLAYYELRSKLD